MTIGSLVEGFLISVRTFKETTADLMFLRRKSQKIEGTLALLMLDQGELQGIISVSDLSLKGGSLLVQTNLGLMLRK